MTHPLDETPGTQRILVIDDDPDITQVVRFTLEEEGFEVGTAQSAAEAFSNIGRQGLPHLAVVDIRMPGMDGIEFSRRVQKYSDLPVILLTAVNEEEAVVKAIDEVAEDYVTKPFSPKVLAARVKRVLRRVGDFAFRLEALTVIDDRLAIDFAEKRALIDEKPVSLTPTETKLLHILIRSARRTVTTEYLLRRLWPLDEVFEDTLRVHVHRLRQKIEPKASKPSYLITQRGVGYSFLPTK